MRRIFAIVILVIISVLVGFTYGYMVHRNQIFPYSYIKKAFLKKLYWKEMDWTIGVYEGADPFSLKDPGSIENPVITAKDVTDRDAAFIADPFMVETPEGYYLFFEVMDLDSNTGDIGYAVSQDLKEWTYKKIVIDEPFHLSYPGIYQWNGDYYMIPESADNNDVRLYRATSFPEEWEYLGELLTDSKYFDPTLFYRDGKWWMYTSSVGNGILNLYYSDSLTSGWQPHPMNPLLKDEPDIARPAGHLFEYDNRLYRVIQDDFPAYGVQVYAAEITQLSTDSYSESVDTLNAVVTMTGKGWNAVGMHQVDLHRMGDKWVAVVDGLRRR